MPIIKKDSSSFSRTLLSNLPHSSTEYARFLSWHVWFREEAMNRVWDRMEPSSWNCPSGRMKTKTTSKKISTIAWMMLPFCGLLNSSFYLSSLGLLRLTWDPISCTPNCVWRRREASVYRTLHWEGRK